MSSGTTEIRARIGLDGAPQFAGQAKAAADSLGHISSQLTRVAASAEDIGRIGNGMAAMQSDARASAQALQQLVGQLNQVQAAADRADRSDRTGGFLARLGGGAAGVAGLVALKNVITGIGDEMLQVSVRADALQGSLRFAVGAEVGREVAYLRRVTADLGLEFDSASRAYAGFAAAARETRLEGAGARQVFESVAGAAAAMGLSADNTQGVLLALQQMMSKGTVQAEELRGQLGERLPGAFQIAARAIGVTTQELGKMLEQGQVLAEDFLPRFAAQLKQEIGQGAAEASTRTEASLNRLANAWERFKGSDNGATAGFIAGQLNIASDALTDYSSSVETARARGEGFFGQLVAGAGAVMRFANPFNALAYGAQATGEQLKQAEAELARLKTGLASNPGNILLPGLIADTERLVAQLREAKIAADRLGDIGAGAGRGFVNPATVGQGLAEQAALENQLAQIRTRALGINQEWVASLTALDAAQRQGLITDAERIRLAQSLTAATYKAGKATEASSDVFAQLSTEIARHLAQSQARLQAGANLSAAQQLELQLNTRLAESLKKLTAGQAERVRQLIATAVASANSADAADRERRAAEQLARTRADSRTAEDRAIEQHLEQVKREREAVQSGLKDRITALEDEASAAALTTGSNLTLAEGIERVALARAREKQSRYHDDSEPWLAVQREIEARERLIALMADQRNRQAALKPAGQEADAWDDTIASVRSGLTDALRRAFESGEDFGTAFAKTLGNEVQTQMAAAMSATLINGVQSLLQGASGGSGNGNNLLSGLASLFSASGQPASTYGAAASSAATGQAAGSASAGAGAAGFAAYAGWAALIVAAVMQASSDWDAGWRRQQARESSKPLGGALLGSSYSAIAKTLTAIGISDKWADILSGSTGLARAIGRRAPRIDESGVAGTLGGGDFSGHLYADVSAKGGWLRRDKRWTETQDVPDELGRFLDDAAKAVYDQAHEFGTALGLPAEQLKGVTADIEVAFGDDAEKNKEALAEALSGYGEKLAETGKAELAPLAGYGESAADTIARVGTALAGVNSALESLGFSALQASLQGGQAAVELQALFGDLATLEGAAGSYLQSYYSDDERETMQRGGIASALEEVGLAVPATREAFRSLVEAQDLMTESGREAFAVLLGVSEAFAALTPSAAETAAALAEAQERIATERQTLQRELWTLQGDTTALHAEERAALDQSNHALYDQIRALELQREAAQKAADAIDKAAQADADRARLADQVWGELLDSVREAWNDVSNAVQAERQRLESAADTQLRVLEQQGAEIQRRFDAFTTALGNTIDRLRADAAGDGGRADALQTLREASKTLRAGGSVDLEATRDAANIAARVETGSYATASEYRLEQLRTLALLKDVQSAGRQQQTRELGAIAAQQVAIEARLGEQLGLLDQQLQSARSAAQSLISIDGGVLSVAQAIAALNSAIGAALVARGTETADEAGIPTGRWVESGDSEIWAAKGGAVAGRIKGGGADDTLIKGLTGATFTVAEAQAFVNDRLAAGDPISIYTRAVAEGIDSAALDALMGWKPGTSLAEALRLGLPGFETGTAYVPNTGLAIVHQGERILPAADNAALMRTLSDLDRGDSTTSISDTLLRTLLDELRALRRDNAALLAELAENTRRTTDTVEGWSITGMPRTEAAA